MNYLTSDSLDFKDKLDINVCTALRVLEKKGNSAVPLLGEALLDDKYCDQVKILIIQILDEINTKEVIPYLQKASELENDEISIAAARALSGFDDCAADVLIKQLNKVMNNDTERREVLRGFNERSYKTLRNSEKAYKALMPIVLNKDIDTTSRRIALTALAGINIQKDEILTFCKNMIPDESAEPSLREAAIYVISRFKRLDYIDLIYKTIVDTNELLIVQAGLHQLTEYQNPVAEQKIKDFKETIKDDKYIATKQISTDKYYENRKQDSDDRGMARHNRMESKNIAKAYESYINSAEKNIERMNKSGIKIP